MIHILLEIVHLPGPNAVVEMPMKFREQVADGRGLLELDGTSQSGMIKYNAETPVQCAFYDQRTLLFAGDGSALAVKHGDAGIAWVLRYIVIDLATKQARTEREEGGNRWCNEE